MNNDRYVFADNKSQELQLETQKWEKNRKSIALLIDFLSFIQILKGYKILKKTDDTTIMVSASPIIKELSQDEQINLIYDYFGINGKQLEDERRSLKELAEAIEKAKNKPKFGKF